ncbi:MAG: aldose 1-epimerase family protein [Victivallaceae bacterium]|nr:aldose 1-epimerase family protein [Victivallaceae bacterium]
MSTKPDYFNLSREELRKYSANPEQLAHCRLSALEDGNGRGMRIIDINNGSGLNFTVVPDRGLDIVETYFQGIPVAFRAPGGYVNGAKYEPEGFGWLRSWAGGMITTCGLRNVGEPGTNPQTALEPEWGLHGRIGHQSAENLCVRQFWRNDKFILKAGGTLREAALFSENLRLEREISTALGDNVIYLNDKVTNEGASSEVLQLLYHCNFGYPAISPGAALEAVPHELSPRDDEAAQGLAHWQRFEAPVPGFREQCFLHKIPPTEGKSAVIKLNNPALGFAAELSWDTDTLPQLMQWKMQGSGTYALGLEPTNCSVAGRAADLKNRQAQFIEPGEEIDFRIKLSFRRE